MPFTLNMPKLSPTMTEGVIARWLKKPGDYVNAGDTLLEISTDKATVEHNALDEGFLRQILKKDGDSAQVNEPLAIFSEKADESLEGFTVPKMAAPTEAQVPTPAVAPTPPPAPKPAPQPVVQEAPKIAPAQVKMPSPQKTQALISTKTLEGQRITASPLARKLAAEKGLDLGQIKGSGPRGRILSRDLSNAPVSVESTGTVVRRNPVEFQTIPLTPMRKVISSRLQQSKATIPHFYITQNIDATELVNLRETFKQEGYPFTVNDFIVKAIALSMKKHPSSNSGFDDQSNTIRHYNNIDIAIAVTIPGGLITPIVKNADMKSIAQISTEVKGLAKKAKENKLTPEEFMGGSCTISNLGMYGTTSFGAIVNPPQAAIFAIGAAYDAPMVKDGHHVVIGKMLHITLSCDHRVIDGAEAAELMRTLKALLEKPALLLV